MRIVGCGDSGDVARCTMVSVNAGLRVGGVCQSKVSRAQPAMFMPRAHTSSLTDAPWCDPPGPRKKQGRTPVAFRMAWVVRSISEACAAEDRVSKFGWL